MTDSIKYKRLPMLLLVLATAMAVVVMSCGVAMAAEGKPVNAVTSIDVTNTSMKQYDTQTVIVQWAAPAGTHQGDWFTIGLPEELSNSKVSPISLRNSADGKDVADCKLDSKTVTCTFTDYVDTYGSVRGDLGLFIVADHANNGDKGEWTINGKSDGDIPVPDVGPRDPAALPGPGYFAKGGWGEPQDGNDIVAWEVVIGADKFLVGDSTGKSLIKLDDTLGTGLALYPSDQDFHVHIRYANGAEWPKQQWEPELEEGTDYTLSVDSETYSFNVTFNKNSPAVSKMVKWAQNKDLGIQMYYYTIPYAPTDKTTYENTVKGTAADNQTAEYTWTGAWGDGSGVGASVRLTKRDASSHDPLKGAVFNLVVGGDGKGDVIQKGLTSDDKGVVEVDNVYKGDYSLVETQAPQGYEKADPVNFTISDATFGDKATVNLTMDDPRTSGVVAWQKVDSTDPSQRLAGSQWTLTGPGVSERVVDNGKNDLDATPGSLEVGNLAWGRYTLVETRAPAGYQLSAKPVDFTVDASHTNVALPAIANTKTPSVPVTPIVPATPSVPATPLTPATPATPTVPEHPKNPVAPTEHVSPQVPASTRKLATTGSAVTSVALVALALMLAAIALVAYRRRRATK